MLQVTYKAIHTLIPYENNSRTHSEDQIQQIVDSIKEFGFTVPISIDENDGVIAGHGRIDAAKIVGMTEIPTIMLEGLSEAQRAAYVIADNKLALNAGWDVTRRNMEINRLNALNFNVGVLGFEVSELKSILQPEGLTDEDSVPEIPEEPVARRGDVWVLDNHRLMCGDSTSQDDLDTLMDGQLADMVFTDPPWNVNYGASATPKYNQGRKILNDQLDTFDWKVFCDSFAASLFISTKPGASLYCVMSAQEWPVVDGSLRSAGFHWSSSIIWAKDRLVISRKDYHTQYEPIWYGWNEKGARLSEVTDRKQSDLWECKRPQKSELHPTTKPVELINRAVINSSCGGALILDLFGGSGSTLISAEKNGRNCRMMELDPKYCDVIVKRWQDYTGKQAILESNEER